MMRFELGLEKPNPRRALTSALTIVELRTSCSGLVPLAPYIFSDDIFTALLYSIVLTLIALLVFGFVKGRFTGMQ